MMQMAHGLKEEDIPYKFKPWRLVLWDGKEGEEAKDARPYSDMKDAVTKAILAKRCLVLAVHDITPQ